MSDFRLISLLWVNPRDCGGLAAGLRLPGALLVRALITMFLQRQRESESEIERELRNWLSSDHAGTRYYWLHCSLANGGSGE